MKDYYAQFPVEYGDAVRPTGQPRLLPPLRSLKIVSTPTPAPEGVFGPPESSARRKKLPVGLAAYVLVVALGLAGGVWFQWMTKSRAQATRLDEAARADSAVAAPAVPEITAVDTSSPLESGNWRDAPR
jgi:hypothetical protein